MTNFKIVPDPEPLYQPTEQEEWDYWNGTGHIELYVIQNDKDVFEFDVLDYSGCAGGASETVGFDYLITDMLYLTKELKEGFSYTIHDLAVTWYRGDGWNTDDDVEYQFDRLERHFNPITYIKQKLSNLWWRSIGWRLR